MDFDVCTKQEVFADRINDNYYRFFILAYESLTLCFLYYLELHFLLRSVLGRRSGWTGTIVREGLFFKTV